MEPVFGHWIKEIRAQRRTLGTMYVSGFEDALVAVDGLYRFLPIDEALDNASSLLTEIDAQLRRILRATLGFQIPSATHILLRDAVQNCVLDAARQQ